MDISKNPLENDYKTEEKPNFKKMIFFGFVRFVIKFCLWFGLGCLIKKLIDVLFLLVLGVESFPLSYNLSSVAIFLLMWSCIFVFPRAITTFKIPLDSEQGKQTLSVIYSTIMPAVVLANISYFTSLADLICSLIIVGAVYLELLLFYFPGSLIGYIKFPFCGYIWFYIFGLPILGVIYATFATILRT